MPQNLFNDKKEDICGKKNSAKASELQLRNEPTTLQTLVGCSVTTVEIQLMMHCNIPQQSLHSQFSSS